MLLVSLSTTPPQPLLGYTCTSPLAARSSATHPIPSSPSLRTVNKWLGIPYASAERWSKPTPYTVDSYAPPRECYEFGPNPLQGPGAVEPLWHPKEGWLNREFVGASEDCLSLNVFVPKAASEKAVEEGRQLPVMVWIYGGALSTGNASAIRHDASELVRLAEEEGNPVIVVTGNYRLNIFGFLSHPDLSFVDGTSGNYGFHDQIALLTWVRTHIHHFTGSASHITAFGESAGAFSIACLATLRSQPLFHRAILQSGSPSTMAFHPPGYAHWDALVRRFGLEGVGRRERVEGLRKVSGEELERFAVEHGVMGGWGGTVEKGGLWATTPEKLFLEGEWDRGVEEWVLGTNEDEGTLFVKALKLEAPEAFAAYLARSSSPESLQSLYPPTPSASLTDSPASHLLASQLFLTPLHSLALSLASSSSPPRIRLFDFRAPLPQMSGSYDLGVHHGIEIPFVFGTRTFWKAGNDEEKTAEECMRRWSSFAVGTGGKGMGEEWGEWTEKEQRRLVIGPKGGETRMEEVVLSELEETRQAFWLEQIRGDKPTGLGA